MRGEKKDSFVLQKVREWGWRQTKGLWRGRMREMVVVEVEGGGHAFICKPVNSSRATQAEQVEKFFFAPKGESAPSKYFITSVNSGAMTKKRVG